MCLRLRACRLLKGMGIRMKVLWLCNVMMPMIAEQLQLEASNKEGWLSGLAAIALQRKDENGIELGVAFPAPAELFADKQETFEKGITVQGAALNCYGFREDITRPEIYDEGLEKRMQEILNAFQPDIVHCFGTEYPHTLAMCRCVPDKSRILVSIQGLCSVYADAYFADLPEKVIHSVTLRDFLRQDSLVQQQKKFVRRGILEIEALKLTGNIAGRTEWDRENTQRWNPGARYFHMNETLRTDFYSERWEEEKCVPHSIFLSQGDYPIKGLHYMLLAMPMVLERYPGARVYVAGNSIVKDTTLKEKLKISGYGRYLRRLIRRNGLEGKVFFLGRLNAEQMKEQYLKSSLFVCCSSIENSPNSLGEAMLLAMPCVSAEVGGISSIFTGGEDGILYEGYKDHGSGLNIECNLKVVSENLAKSILFMWDHPKRREQYCQNARKHAEKNHDREHNYVEMTEIYANIAGRPEGDA